MNAPLPIRVLQELQAWSTVGGLFQDNHPACEECPHCQHDIVAPQFGDAPEGGAECVLNQLPSRKPSDCPAYQQVLAADPTEESN